MANCLAKMSLRKNLISWNSSWTFYEENGNVNENPNLELQTWFYFIFCAVHYQQCFRWGKKNCCCVLFLLLIACLLGGKKKKTLGVYSWKWNPNLEWAFLRPTGGSDLLFNKSVLKKGAQEQIWTNLKATFYEENETLVNACIV